MQLLEKENGVLLKLTDELFTLADGLDDNDAVKRAIPKFAVLGLQSTGKSSVLRRVSGVDFPTASKLCTRVKTQLSLRRSAGDSRSVRIEAVRGGEAAVPMDGSKSEQEQIKDAQAAVLSSDEKFSNNGLVRISVEAQDVPEVSFVDLPGIFYEVNESEKEDSAMVRALVERTINEPSAFVLHVAPVNADVARLETWKMVKAAKAPKRSVAVLTHADKVDSAEELIGRIEVVVEGGTPPDRIFVVDVKSTSDDDEMASLTRALGQEGIDMLAKIDVHVGCSKLKVCVEKIMMDHVKENVTLLRPLLSRKIAETEAELERIGARPFTKAESLAKAAQVMRSRLDQTEDGVAANELRRLTEKLGDDVMGLRMRPLLQGNEATEPLGATTDKEQVAEEYVDLDAAAVLTVLQGLQMTRCVPEFNRKGFDTIERCKRLSHRDLRAAGVSLFGQRDMLITAFGCYSETLKAAAGEAASLSRQETDLRKDQGSMDWNELLSNARDVLDEGRGLRPFALVDPYVLCAKHACDFAGRVEPILLEYVADTTGARVQPRLRCGRGHRSGRPPRPSRL